MVVKSVVKTGQDFVQLLMKLLAHKHILKYDMKIDIICIRNILCVFVSWYGVSCEVDNEVTDYEPVNIIVDVNKSSDIQLSELYEALEYVVLASEEETLIGSVDKIMVIDDAIYLLDEEISQSLYKFERSGTLIWKIDQQGRGPSEYISPDYFTVDPYNDEILILSTGQKKCLFYDEEGNYKRDLDLGMWVSRIEVLDKRSYLLYSGNIKNPMVNDCNISVTDRECNLLSSYLPISDPESRIFHDYVNQTQVFDKRVNYIPSFMNKIYSIDSNGVKEKYSVIFKGSNFSLKEANSASSSEVLEYLDQVGYPYMFGHYQESRNNVYFTIVRDGEVGYVFFDKNTEEPQTTF